MVRTVVRIVAADLLEVAAGARFVVVHCNFVVGRMGSMVEEAAVRHPSSFDSPAEQMARVELGHSGCSVKAQMAEHYTEMVHVEQGPVAAQVMMVVEAHRR